MLNIPDKIKELFDRDGVRKNFRARFPGGELPDITNKDVVQESVRFTESICSQDVLKFGLTEASVLEFETVGVANMYGMMVEAYCEIDVSSLSAAELDDIRAGSWDGELVERAASDIGWPFFRIPYGLFRVESCPRNQEAMAHRKVTAYSLSYARMSKALADLPTITVFKELLIDPAALLDQATGNNLLEENMAYWGESPRFLYPHEGILYTPQGKAHWLLSSTGDGYLSGRRAYITPELFGADFVKVNVVFDKIAYEAAGMAVVAELTAAGYDLTRHGGGGRVYKTNEEALRDRYPELFAPVIWFAGYYRYTDSETGAAHLEPAGGPLWSQPIENDKLTPTIGFYRDIYDPAHPFAFSGTPSKIDLRRIAPAIVWYSSEVKTFRLADKSTVVYETAPVKFPPVTVNYAIVYAREQASDIRIKIYNTGPAKVFSLNAPVNLGAERYSYVDAYDREALLDGYLELNAMFGKVDRRGKLQGLRLSVDEPVSVGPSQYSEFWWDEYDVEPIGSVLYSFEDDEEGEQELEYKFGSGASVYDMTDNAVLKSLEAPTSEMVQQLLEENFVPHLLPVAFTPIELSMQGQPYLEDGDYLAVTAADGTVARSFNMRHELSGIQVLEAEVTSVSGQIMDSDVEVYG